MWPNSHIPAGLVTFSEKIRNEKLHFFCAVIFGGLRWWEPKETTVGNEPNHIKT